MKKLLFWLQHNAWWLCVVFTVLLLLASPAHAGNSTISTTVPAANAALQSAPIRSNFLAAATDINGLIGLNNGTSAPASPVLGQMWLNTTSTPYVLNVWDGSAWDAIGTLNSSANRWIVPVAQGGTGLITPGSAGNILTSTGSAWASTTPTNTGTVTSVNCIFPSIFNATGCPVTTSGTIAVSLTAEAANMFFAGPSSGGSATPTFRAIVAVDIPTLNQNTTGTAANVTGVVAAANGGTGLSTCSTNGYVLSWSSGAWVCSLFGGTVTNVGLSLPLSVFTISNSPVTGSGTLTATFNTEPANYVWAGPTSGGALAPAFRSLVTNDIPATLNATAFTAPITVGTLGYTDTGILTSMQGSSNSYQQFILRNTNSGAVASADMVVSNDLGTATTYYGNFGINSSGFTGSGSLNLASATYLTATSGELVLGTTTANGIHFAINGGATDALAISTAGKLTATGNVALSGLVTSGTIANAVCTDSSGNLIANAGANCYALSQVYPGAGIANSTGSAWGTSYGVSGTGSVCLTTNCAMTTPNLGTPSAVVLTNATGTAASLTAGNATAATTATNLSGGTVSATTIAASSTITPSQTAGIVGTTTNNNANAGSVGEYVSNFIGSGTPVSLSTGATSNITSISLTAGDWDVTGVVDLFTGTSTSVTIVEGGISTTSATLGGQDTFFKIQSPAQVTSSATSAYPVPVVRLSLSGTTTVYLVANGTFTVSTLVGYGTIRARRVR